MELSKLQYISIMEMPVKRFYDFTEWKLKFNEEISNLKDKKLQQYKKQKTTSSNK
jgi:hypothetical protein